MTTRRPQPMLCRLALVVACVAFLGSGAAHGVAITFHIGPPSLGAGGSNPISIPPFNPFEYELVIVTKSGFETSIGVVPGLLFGNRAPIPSTNAYVSFGGGLILDANGNGPGVYSALGWESSGDVRFNAEVKQAIGFAFKEDYALCPYALRLGVTFIW